MDTDIAHFPLQAVRCKQIACPFTSDCHPIRSTDGERTPELSVLGRQDQMSVGVNGHMSVDMRHSIESNG